MPCTKIRAGSCSPHCTQWRVRSPAITNSSLTGFVGIAGCSLCLKSSPFCHHGLDQGSAFGVSLLGCTQGWSAAACDRAAPEDALDDAEVAVRLGREEQRDLYILQVKVLAMRGMPC